MNTRVHIIVPAILGVFTLMTGGCESRGSKLFHNGKCIECHTIDDKGGSSGPNLSEVGSRRSREYIVQQIKNPKSHKPDTDMPSFEGRLPEKDIEDIADYLSGLK